MFLSSNDQRTPKDDEEQKRSKPERKAFFWLAVLKGALAIAKFVIWWTDRR